MSLHPPLEIEWRPFPVLSTLPPPDQLPSFPFVIRGEDLKKELRKDWKVDLKNLKEAVGNAGDIVGVEEKSLPISEALYRIQQGEELYVKGWEYASGERANEVKRLAGCIEKWEDKCILRSADSPLLNKVGELISWYFLGRPSPDSPPHPHVDPLLSPAWMWLAPGEGEKEWRVLVRGGERKPDCESAKKRRKEAPTKFQCFFPLPGAPCDLDLFDSGSLSVQIAPFLCQEGEEIRFFYHSLEGGDLVFVPGGALHAVKSAGLSIALTHNFVPPSSVPSMLGELERAAKLLEMKYEKVEEQDEVERVSLAIEHLLEGGEIDAILFGLLSSCVFSEEARSEIFSVDDQILFKYPGLRFISTLPSF